ncbi:heterokaryon incompatibility protein-domain-containing protein [Pyrenochaeta sp. MPI-SDFR-AT-0127]|nr:heterokaryon incompatibility protein-domain-containing protein [Pyrenochaeta sp. MPI-SDFR-AT-0127]
MAPQALNPKTTPQLTGDFSFKMMKRLKAKLSRKPEPKHSEAVSPEQHNKPSGSARNPSSAGHASGHEKTQEEWEAEAQAIVDRIREQHGDAGLARIANLNLFPNLPSDRQRVDLEKLKPYEHTFLPTPSSIRLLHFAEEEIEFAKEGDVFPSGGQPICTLETHEIERAPPYLCLSYTWGCPIDSEKYRERYQEMKGWVLASSKSNEQWSTVDVGQNLYRALRSILSTKSSIRHIWIDALCINQNETEDRAKKEKAAQISIMTEIYSRAVKTLVWLGEDESGDDNAFYMQHQIILPPLMTFVQRYGWTAMAEGWDTENYAERLGVSESRFKWKSYFEIYRRAYFGRSWIFQELAFSKDVAFLFGQLTLGIDDLATMALFLKTSRLELPLMSACEDDNEEQNSTELYFSSPTSKIIAFYQKREHIRGIGNIQWLKKIAEMSDIQDLETAAYFFFFSVILQIRAADAKWPQDKIYAALGFLKKAIAPLNVDIRFQPTYSAPIQDIYVDITSVLLNIVPDFAILSEIESPSSRSMKGLPSWVPDYSCRSHQSLFNTGSHKRYNASGVSERRSSPNPSMFSININVIPPTLQLMQCYFLGMVRKVAVPPPPALNRTEDPTIAILYQDHVIKNWKSLLSLIRKSSAQIRFEYNDWPALFATVLGNQLYEHGRPSAHIGPPHFKSYMTQFLFNIRQLLLSPETGMSPTETETQLGKEAWELILESWYSDSRMHTNLIPSQEEIEQYCQRYDDITKQWNPSLSDMEWLEEKNAEASLFMEAMARHAPGKDLFATFTSRIGIGPQGIQAGDKIILVNGARVVYAVRKQGDSYRMVGECYLHGVMNGEMIQDIQRNGWKSIDIV